MLQQSTLTYARVRMPHTQHYQEDLNEMPEGSKPEVLPPPPAALPALPPSNQWTVAQAGLGDGVDPNEMYYETLEIPIP